MEVFDIHVTFVHFKFYPWTFQEVPKTTPASKLATKAATVPETPVRDSKPSPKKTESRGGVGAQMLTLIPNVYSVHVSTEFFFTFHHL